MYRTQKSASKTEQHSTYTITNKRAQKESTEINGYSNNTIPTTVQERNNEDTFAAQIQLNSQITHTQLDSYYRSTNAGTIREPSTMMSQPQNASSAIPIAQGSGRKRTSGSFCSISDDSSMSEVFSYDVANSGGMGSMKKSKDSGVSFEAIAEDMGQLSQSASLPKVMNNLLLSSSEHSFSHGTPNDVQKTKSNGKKQAQPKEDPQLMQMAETCKTHASSSIANTRNFIRSSLTFIKKPRSVLRPAYAGEGSRGAIKTENGEPVELLPELFVPNGSPNTKYQAVLMGACMLNEGGEFKSHPHFTLSASVEQAQYEVHINGFSFLCLRKMVQSKQPIKIDYGIRRVKSDKSRTNKLFRNCQILFYLFIVQPENMGGETEWKVIDSTQVVSDNIICEQQQGPPSITELSHDEYSYEGGLNCGVKGKHLLSQHDNNTIVMFEHPKSGWQEPARNIYHAITTKDSMMFEVPPFPINYFPIGKNTVDVEIWVTVDNKKAEQAKKFTYTRGLDMAYIVKQEDLTSVCPSSILSDCAQNIQNQNLCKEEPTTHMAMPNTMTYRSELNSYPSAMYPILLDNRSQTANGNSSQLLEPFSFSSAPMIGQGQIPLDDVANMEFDNEELFNIAFDVCSAQEDANN